jgi:Tfp pilus assembly protein PilO
MALPLDRNYKMEYTRYRHYFHRLWIFYQKPMAKVSTALLLTLFTIVFFAAFAIRPTLVTVAELLKKIDDQQKVLAEMKKKSAALASAQQEYIVAQSELPKLNEAVPSDAALQNLIHLIEGVAAVHQIALSGVTYGDINYQAPGAPHASGPQSRLISLTVTTDYEGLKTFLTDLLLLPRLLTVESVSLAPPTNSGAVSAVTSANANAPIQMNINLKAHYLPKEAAVTPAVPQPN